MSTKPATLKRTGSPVKKASASKKVGSAIPRRVPDRLKVRVIPKRDDPPSPVPSDSELLPEKGQVVHDLFTNLATDIARNIVHELRIPEKLRYASRFCSKGNKNKNNEDVDFF